MNNNSVWKREDPEKFQQSFRINAPVRLRLVSVMAKPTPKDLAIRKIMDGIITGNWSIPSDFPFIPRWSVLKNNI